MSLFSGIDWNTGKFTRKLACEIYKEKETLIYIAFGAFCLGVYYALLYIFH